MQTFLREDIDMYVHGKEYHLCEYYRQLILREIHNLEVTVVPPCIVIAPSKPMCCDIYFDCFITLRNQES